MRNAFLSVLVLTASLTLTATLVAGCGTPGKSTAPPTKSQPEGPQPAGQASAPQAPQAAAPSVQSAPEPPSPTKEELNDQAFAEMQKGNWPQAIGLARQAVALDPEYAQARFNLGLALYRYGNYEEAKPHLEKAYALNREQVEPGWFLALDLKALKERDEAIRILTELRSRFPDDGDVAGELEALAGVVWEKPPGAYSFLGDRMLLTGDDGESVELRDANGNVLWHVALGDRVRLLVADKDGQRVIAILADDTSWLLDPATQKSRQIVGLKNTDVVFGKFGGLAWQKDLLYLTWDEWSNRGKYLFNHWPSYRLIPQEDQVVAEPLDERAVGWRITLSPDGHHAIITDTDRDGSQGTLYRDGQSIRLLGQGANFTPTGDAVYAFTRDEPNGARTLRVESLDGTELMTITLPQAGSIVMVPHPTEFWLLALSGDTYSYYREPGGPQFTGTGQVLTATDQYIVVQKDGEVELVDYEGEVVDEYPASIAYVTPDNRWLYAYEGAYIRAWRLP